MTMPGTPHPPVFLFGFERSGTTLLAMMVGAHPEIAVPFSVTGLWYRYGARLGEYNGLRARDDLAAMVRDLLDEERIRLWDVKLTADEVLAGLEPGSYPKVVERFHRLYADRKGKPVWANTDISTIWNMHVVNAWFPEARFVHIVRDGRDVALSHETYAFRQWNGADCANSWARSLEVNLRMGSILGPTRYLVVRYEDLIASTEATLRRICDLIGVAYSPAMLNYPAMVKEKVPEDRRWLWPTLDKPPDESRVYRWKTEMSATKRIVFERLAGPMLGELGYETYERIPASARSHILELWYFLGKGGRWERLVARAGAGRRAR